jgi:hypothetical protein
MEMIVVFIILGIAVIALAGYIKKEMKGGDGCAGCKSDNASCCKGPSTGHKC